MSKKMQYCCIKLKGEIEETHLLSEGTNPAWNKKILNYDRVQRCYSIIRDEEKKIDLPIDYCPFCGTKFPKDLVEEFWDVLYEEYGPDYLTSLDKGKTIFDIIPAKKPLPKEFQTDEWWKKRGL